MRMMRIMSIMAVLLCAPLASAEDQVMSATEKEIRAVLDASTDAWNNGDIPGFMESYWQSDALRFASGGDLSFGWKPVLDRYLSRYPDSESMGQLIFADLDIQLLGPDHAMAFGTWRLVREADEPHGLYTLVLRRLPEGWRIVHDHTSAAPE